MKEMLSKLFAFPIIMVDGDKEDRKARGMQDLGLKEEEEDIQFIIGEAECPYYDFVSVTDRWVPTDASFNNAIEGKFDACGVTFATSGSFIVPWNKKRFKKELAKFIESQPDDMILLNNDSE